MSSGTAGVASGISTSLSGAGMMGESLRPIEGLQDKKKAYYWSRESRRRGEIKYSFSGELLEAIILDSVEELGHSMASEEHTFLISEGL